MQINTDLELTEATARLVETPPPTASPIPDKLEDVTNCLQNVEGILEVLEERCYLVIRPWTEEEPSAPGQNWDSARSAHSAVYRTLCAFEERLQLIYNKISGLTQTIEL